MYLHRYSCFLAAAMALLLSGSPVRAHKVNIFAYAQGDSVYTESYFSDGRKCRNSTIEVYASSGELLLRGTTDEEGLFAFPIPRRDDLKIVLMASMGHRNECTISKAELGGTEEKEGKASTPVETVRRPAASPSPSGITQEMDQVLARRLAPLAEAVHRLEKQHQEASFRDVLGGIGYIVGLMGLYFFFRNRRTP